MFKKLIKYIDAYALQIWISALWLIVAGAVVFAIFTAI